MGTDGCQEERDASGIASPQSLALAMDVHRAVLEAMEDAVCVRDLHGRCVFRNPAFAQLRTSSFDARTSEHLGGWLCDDDTGGLARIPFSEHEVGLLRSGETQTTQVRRFEQGVTRYYSIRKLPHRHGNHEIVGLCAIVRDITAQRTAELNLQQQNAVLERIALGASLNDVLSEITLAIEREIPGSKCGFLIVDQNNGRLHVHASQRLPKTYVDFADQITLCPSVGPCAECIVQGQKVFVPDIEHLQEWGRFKEVALVHDLRACFSFPIRSRNQALPPVLGSCALYFDQPTSLSQSEIDVVDRFEYVACVAIENYCVVRAIRLSTERLHVALHAASAIAFEWNIKTDEVRRYYSVESALPENADLPERLADVRARVHVDDRESFEENVLACIRTGNDYQNLYRIVRPDQSIVWLEARGVLHRDANGNPDHLIGISMDVTDRERVQEELRRTSSLLHAVASRTNDAIFVKDIHGKYLFFNEAAATFVGKTVEQVLGKNDFEIFDAQSASLIRSRDLVAMETRGISTTEETLTANGQTRTYLAMKGPYLDESGQVAGVVGISHDITERRSMEEHLRQSQKLEAVGRLAAGVAHDFNNLLAVINGHTELLLDSTPKEHEHYPQLLAVNHAGKRAASLTSQLLAFGRTHPFVKSRLDLNEAVKSSSQLLSRLIGPNIELCYELDPGVPRIEADPSQLEQVIMNLVVNACDAMPHGGTLTLSSSPVWVDATNQTEYSGVPQGLYVSLWVRDTGSGMTGETKERLFEPFYTTKDVGKGTGLGLAVVHGVMSQCGGHVRVNSTVGCGTTFQLLFPPSYSKFS